MRANQLAYKSILNVAGLGEPISSLLESFSRGVYRVAIVDEGMHVAGIVSANDILGFLVRNCDVEILRALEETPVNKVFKKPITLPHTATLREALEKSVEVGLVHFILIDEERRIRGLLTESAIIRWLDVKKLGVPVEKVMTSPIVTCSQHMTLYDVSKKLSNYNIKRVLVKGLAGIYGYISTLDILRWLMGEEEAWSKTFRELASKEVSGVVGRRTVFSVRRGADISEVISLMRGGREEFSIVEEEGEPIGIVTERDVIVRVVREIGVEEFLKHIRIEE